MTKHKRTYHDILMFNGFFVCDCLFLDIFLRQYPFVTTFGFSHWTSIDGVWTCLI